MAVSAFGVKCEEERRRGSAPAPPGNTPTSSGVCYSWPLSKISPNLKSICYFSSIWTQSKASIEHSSVESSRSTTRQQISYFLHHYRSTRKYQGVLGSLRNAWFHLYHYNR